MPSAFLYMGSTFSAVCMCMNVITSAFDVEDAIELKSVHVMQCNTFGALALKHAPLPSLLHGTCLFACSASASSAALCVAKRVLTEELALRKRANVKVQKRTKNKDRERERVERVCVREKELSDGAR